MSTRTLFDFLFGTLRGRLIVGVALVHAVMMTLFVVDLTERQRAMLLDRQIEEATALSQALATSAAGWIVADDVAGLQELVDAQRRYPEILFAILVDDRGRVLAHTDQWRQGQHMLDLPAESRQTVLSGIPSLVDVAAPALIGGRQVGWARVGIGQKAAGAKLAEMVRSGILYALAAIVVGALIAWFMGRRLTHRLYAVQETINTIRAGNDLARSAITGTDEAALLAREFNAMLDTLAERNAELSASEERSRSLIRKVRAAIVLHDGQGHILDSNPLAQELLGLSSDQLLGKALIDPEWHFLREDGSVRPVSEYPVSLVLATRQPLRDYVVGIRCPQRDEVAWVLINAEPDYDASGAIARVFVSFVDITGRRRTEAALRRLNRELGAISSCNQALMRAEDEPALLGEICRIVCDEAGYRMAWVGYPENDAARSIRSVAWAGVENGYLAEADLTWADTERGCGASGTAIRSGATSCIQDFATDPRAALWRESALQRGYRASIALPLKDDGGRVFGTLNIYSTEPASFTVEERRLLEDLAGDLAFGIMVLRARAERKQAEIIMQTRLRLLEFAGTHSMDEFLTATLDEVEALTGSRIGFYHFVEPDQTTLALQNWSTNTVQNMCQAEGKGRHYDLTGAGVWVDCVRERRPVIHNDYASLAHRKGLPAGHAPIERELVVPILRGNEIKAIIGIGNKATDYDERDIEIASHLGDLSWDIAERKRVEEALRDSEKKLVDAQRLAHIGYWDRNYDTGRASQSAEANRIFGQPQESSVDIDEWHQRWMNLVHPEDRERITRNLSNALGGGARYDQEYRIVRPDGETRNIHSFGEVTKDESGRVRRLFGTIQDITERKRVEEALRSRNEELEKFERLVVGRELRMVELKSRIARLEEALAKCEGNRHAS
jgi:PAS domain S-box-containing protein